MPHADPGRPPRRRKPCDRRPPDGFARSGVRPVTASKTEFHRRLGNALANDRLRTALRRALPELRERRDARMAEVDWEGLRADLTLRKSKAIDDLPALIERFTTEAEAVGAKVYRAVDAEEARRIVTAICRAKKAKLVVKSKSMATEEIGLTDHLESQGITAVETDLGEWIIQLAGERPSHLIAPAIHKTREEVAQLFAKVVGHPVADDTASLVAVARKELRQSFIDADIGITGGNALIAETGTLMLVTNEGNADLATTLPSVHIAVVGIEKIVPTIDDAIAIVKLLARSGTGQKITSYTVCPVSIPLASLITDVRAKAVEKVGMPWAKKLFLRQWSTPERIDRLTGWLATFQDPLRRNGNVRLPFGALAQEKSLPAVADRPLHYRAREITSTNPKSPELRVAMFPSCIVDHFLPNAGYAAARVLQALGAEVHVVEGRRCCGLPQLNGGDRSTAITMAKAAIESLEQVTADRIVIPSSSCAITIAQDYARMLGGEPAWAERARKLADRITAFTPFVARLARERKVWGRKLGLRATYHEAYQSANVLGIGKAPRGLLREVAGVEIVEMAESSICCGFGGSFSFEFPEVANRVLERKLANIEATGVDLVIADNPGCLTHLRGALDARRKETRVRHLAEVLWEALS